MRYRTLGRTGMRVSILAFGASPLGDVFAETDEAEGARAVHYALDQAVQALADSMTARTTKAIIAANPP